MLTINITLPYHGDVSVNRYLQMPRRGKPFIRQTAEMWGLFLSGALRQCLPEGYDPAQLPKAHPFDMDVEVHFPRRFSTRSGDGTNFDKFPRDVVAKTLGVDDAGTHSKKAGYSTYGNGKDAKITITVYLYLKGVKGDKSICLI